MAASPWCLAVFREVKCVGQRRWQGNEEKQDQEAAKFWCLARSRVWRGCCHQAVWVRGGRLIPKSVERGTEERAEGRRAWERSRCRTRSRAPSVRRRQRRAQLRLGAAAAPKWEGVLHGPGIEPGPPAWQARILPLNHPCTDGKRQRKLAQRNSPPAAAHWSQPAVGFRPIGASTRGWPDGASRRGGSRHVEGPEAGRGGRAEGERPTGPILRFLCRPGSRDCPPGSPGEGPAVARARMPVWAGLLWRALLSADPRHRPKVFVFCFCLIVCLFLLGDVFPPPLPPRRTGLLSCVTCRWGWGGGGVSASGGGDGERVSQPWRAAQKRRPGPWAPRSCALTHATGSHLGSGPLGW